MQEEWCCDALSGIDDALEEYDFKIYECVYCYDSWSGWKASDVHQKFFEMGKHLIEKHAFGACNLAVTYQTWEDLELHLRAFHNMSRKDNRSISRFQRQKRPYSLFRGDIQTRDQPLLIVDRSTECLILAAKVNAKLDELGLTQLPEPGITNLLERQDTGFRWLDQLEFEKVDPRRFGISGPSWKRFPKIRYEIACIEEEFIVSCNVSHSVFEKLAPERSLLAEAQRDSNGSSDVKGHTPRDRINDWFFQTFKESRTLTSLLRSGKISPEVKRSTSVDWVLPIIEFWDLDEAATGLGGLYETSDGAVDSRDSLRAEIGLRARLIAGGNIQKDTKRGFQAEGVLTKANQSGSPSRDLPMPRRRWMACERCRMKKTKVSRFIFVRHILTPLVRRRVTLQAM